MKLLDLQKNIIYGPVRSRRLGRSLGINLLPNDQKICTMNCRYCQYGWTEERIDNGVKSIQSLPSRTDIAAAVESALQSDLAFDVLTLCGNGEPTLHPDFAGIVKTINELKNIYRPASKLAILSNSTTCHRPEIRKALAHIDIPIMKLDAGNEEMFRKINRTSGVFRLSDIVDAIRSLRHYVIQSMFVKGAVDNTEPDEVNSWIDRLNTLKPSYVQIYSLDRGTPDKQLEKVSAAELRAIARTTELKTGFKIEIYCSGGGDEQAECHNHR
jgi:wyosine [tRNA(Phe)-imidazoG37] synthetase (radical SAM superfamily)